MRGGQKRDETERQIGERIERLGADKTVIAVTHRLQFVKNFDRIYVMEGGRIAESGSHEELVETGGRYSRLWEMRKKEANNSQIKSKTP